MELELERVITTQRVANRRYEVWALNDDDTAFDTVIKVFQDVFRMSHNEAALHAVCIHKAGEGKIRTYSSEDVALAKAEIGMELAREFQKTISGCKDAKLVLEVREAEGGDGL